MKCLTRSLTMIIVSGPNTLSFLFFFFNDTATTEIYTLSLHDALPISSQLHPLCACLALGGSLTTFSGEMRCNARSEEHTSELQSQSNLVCRLLLEKKKKNQNRIDFKSTRLIRFLTMIIVLVLNTF